MGECYNCERLEERYDNLKWNYNKLSNAYDEIKDKYNNTYDELQSAEFKIRTELETRIKSEQRSYDVYVTSGGSAECFQNGMNGHCGYECSIFGDKPECFENINNEEEILNVYENYIDDGYILELIEMHGLQEKAKEIDRNVLRNQINKHQEEIEKLQKRLLEI